MFRVKYEMQDILMVRALSRYGKQTRKFVSNKGISYAMVFLLITLYYYYYY